VLGEAAGEGGRGTQARGRGRRRRAAGGAAGGGEFLAATL